MKHLSRSILLLICLTVLFTSFVVAKDVNKYSDLLLIRVDGKAGFIDKDGKIVIEPQFDNAEDFSESFAPVKINDKWGFIDELGKIIIEPQFDWVVWHYFSEGVIPVKFGDKMGAIDKTGSFVIQPKYESVGKFSEGVVPVSIEKEVTDYGLYYSKWIYLDRYGNQIIDKVFGGANEFVDGRTFVKVGFDEWALIDKTGKEVTKKHFDSFDHFNMFSDGLVAVKYKKKYGYINKDGKFIIKPQFDYADNFSEGLAVVKKGCNYGYINTKGKFVIQPNYSSAGNFSEGLADVSLARNNGTKIKSKGKFTTLCSSFHSGLTGYIDKTGKMVIEPQFGRGFEFSNGIAMVSFGESNHVIGHIGKRGYVDKTGKYIWKPTN